MRWTFYMLGVALVVIAAFWSYKVTYRTQAELEDVADLRRAIADEREAIAVLSAEWAWLNAPDRLEALVIENNEALALRPMEPDRFADLLELPAPQPDDGLDPQPLIDLGEPNPDLAFAPAPTPRPRASWVVRASPPGGNARLKAARARLTGWSE